MLKIKFALLVFFLQYTIANSTVDTEPVKNSTKNEGSVSLSNNLLNIKNKWKTIESTNKYKLMYRYHRVVQKQVVRRQLTHRL
jgi:ABC-type uncharacterized transport system YnjBCD substrate-binding protein